jgi:2-desacetyl-2-hydroxyethyl bacteriochlorophyllide A dehydrogenase
MILMIDKGKMTAAVYHAPLNIVGEKVEIPHAGPGEILVKVKACGICGSDLHAYRYGYAVEVISKAVSQGLILGHEFSGDVVEIGPRVKGIAIGDRVSAIATAGAMAEYHLVQNATLDANVFKLPSVISYTEGATLEPLAISLHCVKLGEPPKGGKVFIIGAGIIGLGIVQCLKAMDFNLKKIIVVDVSDKRLEMAKKIGATDVINIRSLSADGNDFFTKALELAGGIPFSLFPSMLIPAVDVVYDAVGFIKNNPAPPAIQQAMSIVREWGRIVVVGTYEAPISVDFTPLFSKHISIQGAFGFNVHEVLEAIELLQTRKINRDILISHTFPLHKAEEAFAMANDANESVKVVFKIS